MTSWRWCSGKLVEAADLSTTTKRGVDLEGEVRVVLRVQRFHLSNFANSRVDGQTYWGMQPFMTETVNANPIFRSSTILLESIVLHYNLTLNTIVINIKYIAT